MLERTETSENPKVVMGSQFYSYYTFQNDVNNFFNSRETDEMGTGNKLGGDLGKIVSLKTQLLPIFS